MVDETFCKQIGCGNVIGKCGKYPADCMIISMRRSIDSLLSICRMYGIDENSNTLPPATTTRLKDARRVANFSRGVK